MTPRTAVLSPIASARVLVALAATIACAAPQGRRTVALPAPPPIPDALLIEPSTLAAGDQISVQFPYRPAYSQDVTVRADGRVTLPVLGTLIALGKTPEELEAEVRGGYAQKAYAPEALAADRRYFISVNDKLAVRFRGADQLNSTVSVRPDGRITLPLAQSVVAEGQTPESLSQVLGQAYAKQLRRPDVSISVVEFASERVYVGGRLVRGGARDLDEATIVVKSLAPRQVFVTGEVRTPGFVAHQPQLTALQAIVASGGAPRTAKLSQVIVLRRTGVSQPTATFIDLRSDARALSMNDIPLRPFDIVIVPKTAIARATDAVDQYLYQLVPLSRNINFTYFHDFSAGGR